MVICGSNSLRVGFTFIFHERGDKKKKELPRGAMELQR